MSTGLDVLPVPYLFNEGPVPFELPALTPPPTKNSSSTSAPNDLLLDIFSQDCAEVNTVSSEEEESPEPPRKKRRSSRKKNAASGPNKFRPYQAEKWQERFDELITFRKTQGHCLVPHTYPTNPPLARWVKRQRYQYKLLMEGKQSSMTTERIRVLEEIGFIWDSHEAAWEDRLRELLEYKEKEGNCLVPSNYPENPQLATWVKCQRRQYKLYWEGRPSNMTVERIMELEKHGFEWELRSSSCTKRHDKDNDDDDNDKQNMSTSPAEDGEFKMFMDLLSDLSEEDPILPL